MIKPIALMVSLLVALPAGAAEDTLNKVAHIAALTHSERAPRKKKYLWLVPGKEITFYYEWILEDGTRRVQVLPHKLGHVPDERPFVESHPNLARLIPAGINGAGNAFGNWVGNKI